MPVQPNVYCSVYWILSFYFRIQTVDGTAKSSEDFVPVDTVLTFSPNQTHLNYDVMFVNDAIMEPDEVFYIDVTTSDRRVNIKCPRIDFNIINDDGQFLIHFFCFTI